MINLEFLLVLPVWIGIYFVLVKSLQWSGKLARNLISASHCVAVLLVIYIGGLEAMKPLAVPLSTAYFIWDMLYCPIFGTKKDVIKDAPYIWHHIVVLCLLYTMDQNRNLEAGLFILWVGEISNLTSYMVYHALHVDLTKEQVKYVRWAQLIWYGYWRVYVLLTDGWAVFYALDDRILAFALASIWAMSMFWFTVLFRNMLPKESKNK